MTRKPRLQMDWENQALFLRVYKNVNRIWNNMQRTKNVVELDEWRK